MSAGFSLAVVIMSLILWLLWFVRYRHRQTAGLVRYSHLLLGVTLPLISSNMQSGTDIDPRGMMVMVEATSNKNQSQHLRATSFNGQTVHVSLAMTPMFPPGQVGWLVGPCKTRRYPTNFWSFSRPTYVRCQGPFFHVGERRTPPWWLSLRHLYLRRLDTLDEQIGSVLKGLTLGEKSELSGIIADKFSHSGANHLLAVSGLHVVGMSGLFYILLIRLLSIFRLSNVRSVAVFGACAFAYIMVLITDGPIGAIRAFTGMTVWNILSLMGRRPNPLETLALVASLILLDTPQGWTSVGFQLSFVSVWSIITFTKTNHPLLTPLSVSLWTTISTAPLVVYHFGMLSPGGVITNLILVPFVTLILMPTAWIGLGVYSISEMPLEVAGELCRYLLCLLDQFRDLGSEMWILGTRNAPIVLVISIALMCRTLPVRWRALAIVLALSRPLMRHSDEVHFMSVGQGDATVVVSQERAALLDAGPLVAGERLLSGLRRLGVASLEVLTISHQHPDHFAGLEALVGRIPIRMLLSPKRPRTNRALMALERRLKAHGTQTVTVVDQESFPIGAFTLVPYPPNPAFNKTENDASLAVLIHHRHGRILVMGDLEKPGEEYLIAQSPPRVDVLRAGHHGSRTSTHHPLMRTLRPKHVILSLGHENKFGFPHRDVVRRIERHKSTLWRTDIDGRITIEMSPNPKIYGVNQRPHPLNEGDDIGAEVL